MSTGRDPRWAPRVPRDSAVAEVAAAAAAADPTVVQGAVRDVLGGVEIDPSRCRDLAPAAIGADGRLRILPAEFWAATTVTERALFGNRHGLYALPTVELVAHLRELIGGRTAIEIGAGNGVLAEALGITATDSYQQDTEPYRSYYRSIGQPTVPYGPNVVRAHASRAVRTYRPQVVIACWVTHKADPKRPEAGGNEVGVDEADILRHCQTYIHIGNDRIHRTKPILGRPHTVTHPPFLYSRAHNGTPDNITIWNQTRAADGGRWHCGRRGCPGGHTLPDSDHCAPTGPPRG